MIQFFGRCLLSSIFSLSFLVLATPARLAAHVSTFRSLRSIVNFGRALNEC